MTIFEAQKKYSAELQKKKIFTALLDVEVLLGHVLKKPHEFVLAHPENKLTAVQTKKMAQLIAKRSKHCPLAYLTGEKEFFGYPFKVNANVLVPRPETEMLVEEALALVKAKPDNKWRIVDIGTGSGAIILALAAKLKEENLPVSKYSFLGTEISAKSLVVAKKNAEQLGVQDIVEFAKGDLLKPVKGQQDIVIANLPYLSFEEYFNSDFYDVIKWEPKHALTDDKDGLYHFRKFFQDAPKVISRGHILMEMGYDEGKGVAEIAQNAFPKAEIEIKKDYCGFDRVVVIKV